MKAQKRIPKYGVVFDNSNVNWNLNPTMSLLFLQAQERYMNHLLIVRGNVFLNEVFDALGFSRTVEGQIVGWLYEDKNDVVSFGLPEKIDPEQDGCFYLDFNVKGTIFHLI